MLRRRAPRHWATVATFCLAGSWAAAAQAFEVEVDSETTAQGYQLRNAWGDPVLSRRRFLQTLGLHVVGIGENENAAASSGLDMSFHMRMRLDADFAIQPFESNYADYPSAFVPGLQRAPVDLVIGYFDIRNLAGGWLSARLGRQLIVDPLGWWSLDGALLRAELPVFLAFEAYGGFEQRAGLPLSTGRFERDGVWRGDRTSLDANAYPEFLEAGLAPAHGFVLESIDLPVVHARVAYRRVWNTGKVATSPFSEDRVGMPSTTDGMRISQERLGVSADALVEELGALRTGLIHDFPRAQITSWYATLDGFVTSWLTTGIDVDHVIPTFDGDSIWSFFSTEPTTTLLGRGDVGLTNRWRLAVAGGVRWVDIESETSTTMLDVLGRASVRHDHDGGRVGMGSLTDRGERGSRDGVDVFADQWFEDRFLVSGRVSVADWRDAMRTDRSTTSLGYVLGGGFRVGDETMARLEWEHDTNELVGQRYRILASLQLLVSR